MRLVSSKESGDFAQRFARVPHDVRHEPYRVGLLPEAVGQAFVLQPTPFAKEFWIAVDSADRVVGRIGASLSVVFPNTAAIGFFEVDMSHPENESVGVSLLDRAEAWAREQGAKTLHGPLNFNTWFPYRFRVDRDVREKFSWEPVNPPEYVALWVKKGWTTLETYKSQGHEGLSAFAEQTRPAYDRASQAGYTFRPFDSTRIMDVEVPILHDVSMAGFKDNFLFEPLPLEAFRALYVPVAQSKLDLGLSHVAISPQGEPVGFFFCFEDKGYVVYKSVAVKPSARGMGLSNAVAHLAAVRGVERGLTKLITALVKSGAQSESYGKKARLLWEHDYALYEKRV